MIEGVVICCVLQGLATVTLSFWLGAAMRKADRLESRIVSLEMRAKYPVLSARFDDKIQPEAKP